MTKGNWFGAPGDLPPHLELLQLIVGKWASQIVYAAAELGVADALSEGPRTSRDVAEALGTDPDATHRLLRALANLDVFVESEPGTFALAPMGEHLRTGVAGSLRGFARFVGFHPTWHAWGGIVESVRTGAPAFEARFGESLFDWAAKHPEESAIFDDAMTAISLAEGDAVAESFDFSGIHVLADVGGGRGQLLGRILSANDEMKGILVDLPHVVEGAAPVLDGLGVEDRVSILPGSFFEVTPDGADAVILKHIIHDWNDEDAVRILETARKGLPTGGRLLVVEAIVPPTGEKGWANLLDIEMLVLTPRGRERTVPEYAALFEAAGFRQTNVVPTASPVAVIEGVRSD